MKLCRDCKHLAGERCIAPANFEVCAPNFVNGIGQARRIIWYGAQFCREDAKACGPEAKWYEPKDGV